MQNETSFHKPIGITLAVVSGLATIGITVWFSHSAVPLLALILLGWGIEVVSTSKKPLTIGLILSVTYLVIGVAGWYTNSPTVLWAMVLANWFGDSI